MSDDHDHDRFDNDPTVREIEALLGELDTDDLELVATPPELWAAIERRVSDQPVAAVRTITPRRRPNATWTLAAAAAAVLVVAGAVAVTRNGDDGNVVSATTLTFDPATFDPRGADASAEALLVNRDGSYSIRLVDTQLPQLDGDDLELWLIEPDDEGNPVDVASVALVDPDGDGSYDVPAEVDPDSHFVVDISIEPRDGVAAHSGHSILRGALEER